MNWISRDARRARFAMPAIVALAALIVSGCGGGGSSDAVAPAPPPPPPATGAAAAAAATAMSNSNACSAARPFYWEIGDGTGRLASGSVTSAADPTVYTAATTMSIASASKWFYSTYFVQRRAGLLSATDVKFFNFESGYTSFFACLPGQTVQQCVDLGTNGAYNPADDGMFAYGGGHMEKHAAMNGLGGLDSRALADEIRSQVGGDIAFNYSTPQLAGGMVTNADEYAKLLRKILRGDLRMRDSLGTQAVCTNPATCPTARFAPSPPGESWHYSIGHWVEDDPVVGDGAFSSPGAFGFYPWIDAAKTHYGILARSVSGAGSVGDSIDCGRLIRNAWATQTPQ